MLEREGETSPFWMRYVDLLQPRLGSEVIWASDDFFAPKERLIDPGEPVYRDGEYDEHGKWMDGWESRRRRDGGHDACVVRLGLDGIVRGVDIDTSYFDGNQPVAASVEAAAGPERPSQESEWLPLVPRLTLGADRHHRVAIAGERSCRYLRLNIFPDGGVARLRAYGEVLPRLRRDPVLGLVDLAAVRNGGRVVACNDRHFGSPWNLLMPGPAGNMGDGWETRRRRTPGHDWVLLALAAPGLVARVEVDTTHFKGNHPDRVSLQAARVEAAPLEAEVVAACAGWGELLTPRKLEPDHLHVYEDELAIPGAVSHVRVNIHPDGGLSRVRIFGAPVGAATETKVGGSGGEAR